MVYYKEKDVMSMIDNKKIIISRDNQFDKGWTLFKPSDLFISKNPFYEEIKISDIVKKITYSNEVNLILSEPCLSSKIVEEIAWANKWIKLNVIVKDNSILSSYTKILDFTNIKVDNSIDFNYIDIIGKENGFYLIFDGFHPVDDSINLVYFHNKKISNDYSFDNNVDKLIVISDFNKDYTNLILSAKKKKIDCIFITNIKDYTKDIYNYAKTNGLKLFVSDYTIYSILLVYKDNSITRLSLTNNGLYFMSPVERINYMIGKLYECGFYKDNIETNKLNDEMYSCINNKIDKLNIKDKKEIEISIDISEMSDFVNEKFDSSIVNNHNDYSAEAKKVVYNFNLKPPCFDSTYQISNIYSGIHNLLNEWNKNQKLENKRIICDYNNFEEEDYGIIKFINYSLYLSNEFNNLIINHVFKNYYFLIKDALKTYNSFKNSFLDILKSMFNAISKESSGAKFDKFDIEIEGYEKTIKEKNELINKGIDVLSNKRRVEILHKKINDLLELKKQFEDNSNFRNDKDATIFIERCNKKMSGERIEINDDSIGNIVKQRAESKQAKLDLFVDNYIVKIKNYIDKSVLILSKLLEEKIPEEYTVYDKNNQRYIIIDDLKEFESTKSLCSEFDLKCLARR